MKNGMASRAAFGGITAAAAVICLYLAAVFPTLSISLAVIAGLILVLDVLRCGCGFAAGVYAVTAVLAMVLLPDKEPVIWFVVAFGPYPILKNRFERCGKRRTEWLLKGAYAAAAGVLLCCIFHLLGLLPAQLLRYLPLVIAGSALFFIIYDLALSRVIVEICRRMPKKP